MAAIRPSRAMTKSVPVIRKDAAATAGLLSGVWGVWPRMGQRRNHRSTLHRDSIPNR